VSDQEGHVHEAGWRVQLLSDPTDLQRILELQRANLASSIDGEELRAQGFVTAEHSLESLQQMHALAPSVVAKAGAELAGYALTMLVEARRFVPILEPMFQLFAQLSWRGRPLPEVSHYVMGQVCVAKPFRGQGLFDALYHGHRQAYAGRFELLVTEVSVRNARSLRAHERVGFEPIHRYRDSVDEWLVLGWSLR
jgi:RimJ/RimL family protein N-acetyltransferase